MYLGYCIKCKNTFESPRLPKNAIKIKARIDGLPIYTGSCDCCTPYSDFYTAGYTIKMNGDDMSKAIYKKNINSALMANTANKQIFSGEITI